ncbi:beta strand repeat-containing protein [Parabacteroides sp. FAFU027]|uniref:beta strand repeat-containing protein n=1 Tax=Parabacteroides sp. FAFU027 TaxID=2922715 RepID=UPI001FB01135|nr:Ig-like domain-containing protein [Parabacteroides sp. FAFU027]
MKKFLLLFLSFLAIIAQVRAASVTFSKIYQGTGTGYKISSPNIDITTPTPATTIKFTSANPADVLFSGNDVAGQLTFTSGGSYYVYNGVISRKVSGNPANACYFAETTALGNNTETGKAFFIILPGFESSFTNNSSVSTNSAPMSGDLNTIQASQQANVAPVITSNGGGTTASVSITENTTSVTTVTASDTENGTLTYAISGGSDASKFTINSSTGVLTLNTAPNFENPIDAGANNVYDVQVTATDPLGATDIQDIAVTVTNVNDNSPVFTSASSFSVLQGSTTVATIRSTDADAGDALTYSISGGANAALFSINASTGALTFNSAAVNGSYIVIVQVSDGVHTTNQTITVTVSDTDTTPPTLTITNTGGVLATNETCTLYFQFSEQVQNFTLSDISVTGGTLGSTLTQSPTDPTLYTVQFTKNSSAVATTVSVAAASYQDMSNNNGQAASLTLNYDVVAPSVLSITANASMIYNTTQIVTFTFSENPGSTFAKEDISVTNGSFSNLQQSGTDPTVWTATLLATSSVIGPSFYVSGQSYTDLAGNAGAASGSKSITLAEPSIDLKNDATNDTGTSSSDNITTNRKPIITGNGPAGGTATILVFDPITSPATIYTYTLTIPTGDIWSLDLSSAQVKSGTIAFPSSGLSAGNVGLTITVSTKGNNDISAYSSFTIDLTAPAAPTVTNLSTSNQTPTISGTVTIAATDVFSVTVNGVTYTYGGGNLTYENNSHTWALTIPNANTLALGSYTVTATLSDAAGNTAQGTGSMVIGTNSWTGTGSWATPANWSTGITPSSVSKTVVTSGTLTIDQDVTVSSLTLNSGANLTLSSGKKLTVTGDFVIKGDGSFVDQGGTLVVTGSTKVMKGMTHGRNWYISSPVSAAQSSVVTTLSGTNHLWIYDEPNVVWNEITNTTTPFGVMTGYIVNTSVADTVVFTGGSLNTGPLSLTINRTENGKSKRGFNLVGNPYISSVDWSKATKTNLTSTVWYRSRNMSSTYVFDTYNALAGVGTNNNQYGAVTKYIPPMQAFWVRVDAGATTGSLGFDNSMRTHNTTNFLRSAQVIDNQAVRLQVTNGASIDESVLVFNSNFSDSFDDSDSPKMTNDNASIPEICTVSGSDQMVINCMNSDFTSKEIPLGFKTGKAGSFTINAPEITNIDPSTSIFLYDKQLNTTQDLSNGESYTFTSAIANTTSRFSILMSKVTTGLSQVRNDLAASISEVNGQIKVTIKDQSVHKGDIAIFNTLGQQLTSVATTGETTIVDAALTPGIYLITVKADGKTTTKKLAFK